MVLPLVRMSFCTTLAIALHASVGAAGAANLAESAIVKPSAQATTDRANAIVLANQILNRWQPVAEEAGALTPIWREQYLAQLASMDDSILEQLDRVNARAGGAVKARYARFVEGFRSAVMHTVMLAREGKSQLKLGLTDIDQVFIPITPCRIVDTRNVGGPIATGTQRAFVWVRGTSNFTWASQGGAPGPGATTCPGTVFAYAGGTLPGSPANTLGYPRAAVATVTVVNATAPGNFLVWGGAPPFPQSSTLNFTAGQTLANTTVIPWGGRTSPPDVQDFSVRYNGPSGQADVIVDVVGFFVPNSATPLDCVDTPSNVVNLPAAAGYVISVFAGGCPTGYTFIASQCENLVSTSSVYVAETSTYGCSFINNSGATAAVGVSNRCCRVPGQ